MGSGDFIAQMALENTKVTNVDYWRTAKFFGIGFIVAVSTTQFVHKLECAYKLLKIVHFISISGSRSSLLVRCPRPSYTCQKAINPYIGKSFHRSSGICASIPWRPSSDHWILAASWYWKNQNQITNGICWHFKIKLLCMAMGAIDQFPFCAIKLSSACNTIRCGYVEHVCIVAHQFKWTCN